MAEVKNPKFYQIERTDHPAIAVHHDAEMARVAAAATQAAHDEQQFTKVNGDAQDLKSRPWDVSYAFAWAAVELLGHPLTGEAVSAGMFGGTILPGLHSFNIQSLVYLLPNGQQCDEKSLEEMKIAEVVNIAEHAGSYVPTHYSAEDRQQILDDLIKHLEIVGVTERTIKVPYGKVKLTYLSSDLGSATIGAEEDPDLGILGNLEIEVQKKNVHIAEALLAKTKEVLSRKSIYKGRAIDSADDRPKFWNPFKKDPEQMVFSETLLKSLQINVMYPIKWRERALVRLPSLLKRTLVWTGDYGTGKTETMVLMAQWAIKHGWTVIRHKAGSDDLSKTMKLARIMEPCLLLVEDIDVFSSSNDEEVVSKLLDDFDGMLSKAGQVITIFTTNHEEKITKGMKRPGRIDNRMQFGHLDGRAKLALIINLLGDHTLEDKILSGLFDIKDKTETFVPRKWTYEEMEAILDSCEGYPGAFIAEMVKRAMLAGLDREQPFVEANDLIIAANSLREQFEMFKASGEPEQKVTLDAALGEAIGKVFGPFFNESIVKVQMDTREGTFAVIDK